MKGLQNLGTFLDAESSNNSFTNIPFLRLKRGGVEAALVKLLPVSPKDLEEFSLFAVHYIQNRGTFLCTAKQHLVEDNYKGSPCPICDELKKLNDDDIKKQSKTKNRWLIPMVVLITQSGDEVVQKPEIMVFNTSTKTKFAKKLSTIIMQNPDLLSLTDTTTFLITVGEENGFTTYDIKKRPDKSFNYGEVKDLIDEFYKEHNLKDAFKEATEEDADYLNPDDFKVRKDDKKNKEEEDDLVVTDLETLM